MNNSDLPLTQALGAIEKTWLEGTAPPTELPGIPEEQHRLAKLLSEIRTLQGFAIALSNGYLAQSLKIKGFTAGSLKTLQANLRHLTWQTKMIASGDLTQHVDFMGEFAESFNAMVRNLAEARDQIHRREVDLSEANAQLRSEITERERAEQALREANEKLQAQLSEIQGLQITLREQAIRDSLTNLFNRRYLQETLERELAGAERDQCPITIIMMDIDHFKRLNDNFGHQAGDLVLQALGKLLREQTRHGDVACRYGGEEFVIVMPGAPLATGIARAEEFRAWVQNLQVHFAKIELQVTLSLGVAAYPVHGATGEQLLRATDQALYAAKAAGRNRVMVADTASPQNSL